MTSQTKKRAANGIRNDIAALEQNLGPIEYWTLASLKRYENNPRRHPEKQLIKLAASIREFGFVMPMLVDEQGSIIAGEARLAAARRVGMTTVPVIVAHHWSSAQVRSYRLADNRLAELGAWDSNALAIELATIIAYDETPVEILGWETAEIDLVLAEDFVPTDETSADPADDQIEPPAMPVSRAGDLWLLGEHRLLCGSSLDTANWTVLLEGRIAAMAFTEPPCNVAVSGHVCGLGKVSHADVAMASGEMTKAEFTAFLSLFIAAMLPHCKDGAVLDLCMDWRHLGELLSAIEGNELSLLNLCAWNKNNGDVGIIYRSKHQLVFITKKGKAPHTNNVELGKRGRYRSNVWDYAGIKTFGKDGMKVFADHPTVRPTALVADAIRDVTHPGEIVLGAFVGFGTTILACERTKRRGFGIEIEPGYVDVAIRRWEAMTGKKAVLLETGQGFAEIAALRADNSSGNEARTPSNVTTDAP